MTGPGDHAWPALVEGALGSIPGAGAFLAPFAGPLIERIAEEHARRRSISLRAAEHASGMTREDLEEVLAADPDLVSLTITLLHAAGMNGHDEALMLLGRVLGRAAVQPELTDVARDSMAALAGLREGHFRVLAQAARRAEQATDDGEGDGRWSADQVARSTGIHPELITSYVAALVSAGLVMNAKVINYPGGSRLDYIITAFGRRLVEVAQLSK